MPDNDTELLQEDEVNAGQVQQGKTGTTAINSSYKLVVAVSLVLLIFSGCIFYLGSKIMVVNESTRSLTDTVAAQNKAFNSRITNLDNDIKQLRFQHEAAVNSINDMQRQQPVTNEDWALAEIEYLLIIATHRLLLERDVNTAVIAMETAESRLRELHNTGLIHVREQLVTDINQLKAVNNVDITGLSIYLADIIDRASSLPLKNIFVENKETQNTGDNPAKQEQSDSAWRNFVSTVWHELKSLVVIKRSGEIRQAVLLPDQEYFLYQNLRLELENARLSVLRRDTENLKTSVNLLVSWLNDYFDANDTAVQNIIETLVKMSVLDLKPELPDINSSLETLRAYIKSKGTGNNENTNQ